MSAKVAASATQHRTHVFNVLLDLSAGFTHEKAPAAFFGGFLRVDSVEAVEVVGSFCSEDIPRESIVGVVKQGTPYLTFG